MATLKAIESDAGVLFDELKEYIKKVRGALIKSKIVIGNDLGSCKREGCTAENPCTICRSLRSLDEEIDNLL